MRHDVISDVLSSIKNGDLNGKQETITVSSRLAKDILLIIQKYEYIGEFEHVEDNRGGKLKIKLLGKVNNCGAIRPRYSAKKDDYVKFERRFLPAVETGLLIVSTSKGVMAHTEAKKMNLGGKLLAFIY